MPKFITYYSPLADNRDKITLTFNRYAAPALEGGGSVPQGPAPTRKIGPLGGAVARVFPNVSLAMCAQNSLCPPLARLWRRYCRYVDISLQTLTVGLLRRYHY